MVVDPNAGCDDEADLSISLGVIRSYLKSRLSQSSSIIVQLAIC